jgi:hypothetical protein
VKATHATSRTTLTLHRLSETRTGARIVSPVRRIGTVVGASSRPSGIAATRTRFLQFGHSMEFPSYRSSAWASRLHSGQVKVITAKFGGGCVLLHARRRERPPASAYWLRGRDADGRRIVNK